MQHVGYQVFQPLIFALTGTTQTNFKYLEFTDSIWQHPQKKNE